MRFQVTEMVESQDAELVSRALETNLRTQWSDVAREGDTIVLRGLGPTHRVNRNDRAVFSVKPVDDRKTAIEVDATYLASALVGAAAPQNEIMQRKLDGVLELVRMDVDLAQRRAALEKGQGLKPRIVNRNAASMVAVASPGEAASHPVGVAEVLAPTRVVDVAEIVPPLAQEVPSAESARVVEQAARTNGSPKPSEDNLQKVLERIAQREGAKSSPAEDYDDIGDDIFSPRRADLLARRKAAMQAAQMEIAALSAANVGAATEQHLVHRGEFVPWEDDRSKLAKDRTVEMIFAVLLVTFLMAFAAQMGWQYRGQVNQRLASWRAELSAERVEQSQTGLSVLTPEQQAAQQQAERVAAAADAEKAAEAARLAEPDPKQWLQNWAETFKGTDAGVQAAYYADTVDKYFLEHNVSRAEVMASRQDAIAKRKGTWTMRLDDLVVAQQTDTTARVLFVKYIATDSGSGVVEQRLPTQIKLKRIEGQWRIVSEQTLG